MDLQVVSHGAQTLIKKILVVYCIIAMHFRCYF